MGGETGRVCCPRQNGKNAILEARQLAGLFIFNEKFSGTPRTSPTPPTPPSAGSRN
jgi:hypothetical protein